jgi:HAD superfamily hydrolase (TIGR01549 family)
VTRHGFKGILFDVDGTLSSTNELIFASFNHVAEKYLCKKLSDEEVIALFGPPEDEIIEKLFPEIHAAVKSDYYKFYQENHGGVQLYDGLLPLLQRLRDDGVILGIFTGKGRVAAEITLRELCIHHYFSLIVSGDDVACHKPSGEGIRQFLDAFNLSPEEVLMVGDAPPDFFAARETGVHIASVIWDSYAKEEVMNLNPDFLFTTGYELTQFLYPGE